MTAADIENIIILLFIFILLICGAKRRFFPVVRNKSVWSLLLIDKKTSIVIKGIACVFVLMGHYGTWLINSEREVGVITTIVTHTTANIALTWFMFFSGFGLSLKIYENCFFLRNCVKRVSKIYLPLLYVCICASLLYLILPYYEHLSGFSSWYDNIHILGKESWGPLIYQILGLSDWYVVCIIYYVLLFYLSAFISIKWKCNVSLVLGVLLLCYIVAAFFVYGPPQAHFYRYPWVFMLGHLVATHKNNAKWINISLLLLFSFTWCLLDKICIFCFIIALILLASFSLISQRYDYNGRYLLFLGGVSYFFYLSHQRIGWFLLLFLDFNYTSVIGWVFITILCSILLDKGYNYITSNIKQS